MTDCSIGGGFIGAAVVLMISDRFLPGLEVEGFSGVAVAAIALAVDCWSA